MRNADRRAWVVGLVLAVLLGGLVAGCKPTTQATPATSATPAGTPEASKPSTPPPAAPSGGGITWTTGLESGSQQAAEQKKPMMVDFYTDWCSWCKKLDKETYTDAAVVEKAKSFVAVKVNAEEDKAGASKYNVDGFPTIVFLDSAGNEIHRVTGYEPGAEFVKEMETALGKAK